MANTFITPTVIAARGLAILYNNTLMASLVARDWDAAFAGKVGDTITIRKPAMFTAAVFDTSARTTTWQDATEDSTTLVLDTITHVPFLVTDEQMTLEITDFQNQLLVPAMEAIAQKIDGDIAEKLVDAAEGVGGGGTATMDTKASDALIEARTILSRANMPMADRYAALSPEGWAQGLHDSLLIEVDTSGSPQALRNGILGRIVGFETYESNVFGRGAGDRGVADGVAFHRDAFVVAIRPLQQPRGIPSDNYSVQNYRGLSLRVIYSYDHAAKQDKVTVDIMYGMKAVRPEGIVQLDLDQGS